MPHQVALLDRCGADRGHETFQGDDVGDVHDGLWLAVHDERWDRH